MFARLVAIMRGVWVGLMLMLGAASLSRLSARHDGLGAVWVAALTLAIIYLFIDLSKGTQKS